MTGFYGISGTTHGFVRAADGSITVFDPEQAVGTEARAINDAGVVAGDFFGNDELYHGFVRTP